MDKNLWSSDETSQLFRQHMEDEINSCQSGQQLILDLVRPPLSSQLTGLQYNVWHDILQAQRCIQEVSYFTRHA